MIRAAARALHLGPTAYHLWHRPIGAVRRSFRDGGPLQQWITARGRHAMEQGAMALPVSVAPGRAEDPELHFLTGRAFWYQTAFCLHTLQSHAGRTFRATFHDDGTLDESMAHTLRTLFPAASVIDRREADERAAALLPVARFPHLHRERLRPYPNFLKLTDVHAGRRGWRLVLDSDMLFFRRPDFLLDWFGRPQHPLHLLDVADAYGYPRVQLSALAGKPVAPCVNAGFAGIASETIDWEQLEYWCSRLIETARPSYYLEQALTAMLFAQQGGGAAPAGEYVVLPDAAECRAPRAVLHHYVAGSKPGYFRHAWRNALEAAAATAGGSNP